MFLVNQNDCVDGASNAPLAASGPSEEKLTVLLEMPESFDLGFDFDFDEMCKEAGNDTWHLII